MKKLLVPFVYFVGLSVIAAELPEPKIVTPGDNSAPPSDAIVLFDGKDLSNWKSADTGADAPWKVEDGVAFSGKGYIATKQEFGAIQLHIEWAAPTEVKGNGQGRGNSGVYIQGRYEVQVLDSYENKTYADGQAGAVYKVAPPLVNACRKPGEWQTYDILFHPPLLDETDGKTIKPGSVTVLHNGVLIQHNIAIKNPTVAAKLKGPAPKGPLMLQDHGNPVRFRNIWVREL